MTASKHGWHSFDEAKGYQVRQSTNRLRKNAWEVLKPSGEIVPLTDTEFEKLRDGYSPKGL